MQDAQDSEDVDEELQSQSQEIIDLDIRAFKDLVKVKDTQEYLKPYSFEMCARDSDDACQVAVMIVKRLMGSDEVSGSS